MGNRVLAYILWGLNLYLWRPSVLRKMQWPPQAAFWIRLAVLSAAFCQTLRVDEWAVTFDGTLGVHNLARFLKYLFVLPLAVCALVGISQIRGSRLPRYFAWLSLFTLALLVALFVPFAHEPEQLDGEVALTPAAFASLEAIYLYLFFVGLRIFRDYDADRRRDTAPIGRARGILLGIAFACVIAYVFVRIFVVLIFFLEPSWIPTIRMFDPSGLFAASAILTLGISHLPITLMRRIVLIWGYVQQERMLMNLRHLRQEMVGISKPLPWRQPSWLECLRNPSHALYCTLIDILDRRTLVLANIAAGDAPHRIPPAARMVLTSLPANQDWVEMAQSLDHMVRTESRDY